MATSSAATASASISRVEPGRGGRVEPAGNLIEIAADAPDLADERGVGFGEGTPPPRVHQPKASRIRSEMRMLALRPWREGAPFRAPNSETRRRRYSPGLARRCASASDDARAGRPLVGFEGEACLPSQGSVSYDTGRLAPCFKPARIIVHHWLKQAPGHLADTDEKADVAHGLFSISGRSGRDHDAKLRRMDFLLANGFA